MSTTGWNMAMSTRGLIDLIICEQPNETQFAGELRQFAPSVEFYKPCLVDSSSQSNKSSFGRGGSTGAGTTWRLHDAVDVLSGLWTQTTIPALDPIGNTATKLHLVNAGAYAMMDQLQLSIGGTPYVQVDSIMLYVMSLLVYGRNRLVKETGDYRSKSLLEDASTKQQVFHAPLLIWFTLRKQDALRVCNLGGQGAYLKLTFDAFSNWLVNLGADTWDSAMVDAAHSQLSHGSLDLIARYHYIGDVERDFYMQTPSINLINSWYRGKVTEIANGEKGSTVQMQINFPIRGLICGVRNAKAFDTTLAWSGKYGVKDKFCFNVPNGDESIAKIQWSIAGGPLLHTDIHPSFYKTFGTRNATGDGDRDGHSLDDIGLYFIPTQSNMVSNEYRSSINMSRFENQTLNIDLGHFDQKSELFVYTYYTKPYVQDLGSWSLPFGMHSL